MLFYHSGSIHPRRHELKALNRRPSDRGQTSRHPLVALHRRAGNIRLAKTKYFQEPETPSILYPEEGDTVKLAEALILRAECNKRIEQLRQRIIGSAMVQEGGAPPENPRELLEEFEQTAADLMNWICRINRTNSMTEFHDGGPWPTPLREGRSPPPPRAYSQFARAHITQDQYSQSEVRYMATLA